MAGYSKNILADPNWGGPSYRERVKKLKADSENYKGLYTKDRDMLKQSVIEDLPLVDSYFSVGDRVTCTKKAVDGVHDDLIIEGVTVGVVMKVNRGVTSRTIKVDWGHDTWLHSSNHLIGIIDNDTLTQTTCPLEDIIDGPLCTGQLLPAGARKDDTGKVLAGINYEYFAHALNAVAEVSTFGANKYSRGGFRHVPNKKERYLDGFHRHLLADAMGDKHDAESGLLHKAHAAWNALALLQFAIEDTFGGSVKEEEKAYRANI